MPTLPKPPEGGNFTPPPEGTMLAVCYRILDLGTQQVEWNGSVKHQHKILLSWELPNEPIPDGEKAGEPFTVHQRYTFSTHEKATFRKHLEAWRGKKFQESDFGEGGFDIKNVLGKACFLTIVHNVKGDNTYANIGSVAALPRGTPAPETTHNPITFLWLEKEFFDQDVFNNLSEGLQDAIRRSPEYQELSRPTNNEPIADAPDAGGADLDDEIPF